MSSSLHYSGVALRDSFRALKHVVVGKADDVCWYVFWNSLEPRPAVAKSLQRPVDPLATPTLACYSDIFNTQPADYGSKMVPKSSLLTV